MILQLIKGKRILCYLCILFIAGIYLRGLIWGKPELELPVEIQEVDTGTMVTINGEITGLEQKEYSQYIYIKTDNDKWLIYDTEFLELDIGNQIQISGELSLFDVARNPGNFDLKNYYNTKGIVAGIEASSIVITDNRVNMLQNSLYQLRLKGVDHIYSILGQEQGCLLAAMIFGETDDMEDEQQELYQKIGISHIFAISGLHISLISLAIYQSIRKITGSFTIAGFMGSVFLILYVLLIGMGISAIRASIMFLLRVGSDISGRTYDMQTSLAIAAMCILIPNPLYLYNGGFLLSFGAILGVIYLVPFWKEVVGSIFNSKSRIEESGKSIKKTYKEKLLEAMAASIGIQIMILPILLYFYYEVSPYSILLNIIVIPIMTVLLGIAMIGIVLSFLWYGAGVVCLTFSAWLLQVIEFLGETVLTFYQSRIVVGQPPGWVILIYYLGIFAILVYIHIMGEIDVEEQKRKKIYSKLSVACLLLTWIFIIPNPWIEQEDLTITMLDVDQGDGIYISGKGLGNYFIDGGSSGVYEVGKYRIEPYLLSIGVDSLDYVFISHGDSDHLNGIEEMLARQHLGVEIKTLVLCAEKFHDDALTQLIDTAKENGTEVMIIEAGDVITDGALEITCLAPLETYDGAIGNESSMVLQVSYEAFQALFTGDVEAEGEEALIEILAERGETYEILKVAHHGSKNSTTAELLDIIEPEIALISAGVDSIYGHPHEETITLLESYGCEIYSTPTDGGVILSYNSNDDTISIEETIVTK